MLENEYQWFLENYNELFKQYGTSFLALKNKSVLGVYQSYAEGVKKTLQNEEPGTFIVQKCNGEKSAYTNYISSMCFC
jgi:hypothetical protein